MLLSIFLQFQILAILYFSNRTFNTFRGRAAECENSLMHHSPMFEVEEQEETELGLQGCLSLSILLCVPLTLIQSSGNHLSIV